MSGYTGSIADHGRVRHIAIRREREREDMEAKKRKIAQESSALGHINDKFSSHYDAVEMSIRTATVGLVTLEEMKAKRAEVVHEREKQLSHARVLTELEEERQQKEEEERRRVRDELQRKQTACLSFDLDDEEDEEEDNKPCGSDAKPVLTKKPGKDPSVDTSFLPDKERQEAEDKLREQLRDEWAELQEVVKNEHINIAYSYWDGSGHRRDTAMRKGNTIHQFLCAAVDVLRPDFHELKTVSADSLMFVKEDLIIPHYYSFHDFIVTKAVGKTGPLFEFDAKGELRIRNRIDKSTGDAESHPAKVVLRSWYERNKHIYPASRWEPFDPTKCVKQSSEPSGKNWL